MRPWWYNLFCSGEIGAVFSLLAGFINAYVVAMITYLLTMFCGRKRFGMVSTGKAVMALFTFPLFLLSQFILDIQAAFSKNLKWKQIPHTGRQDAR